MNETKEKLFSDDADYHVACIKCRSTENLSMFAHRHEVDGPIVGLVFTCDKCLDEVRGSTLNIVPIEE